VALARRTGKNFGLPNNVAAEVQPEANLQTISTIASCMPWAKNRSCILGGMEARALRAGPPAPTTPLRRFFAACIVCACFCFVACLYVVTLTPRNAVNRDSIEFWVAGRQLIHHANPYDLAAILRIERGLGLERSTPRVSYSPPTGLSLMLPLGLLSAKSALVVWLMAQLSALALSCWLLWRLFGRPDSMVHLLVFAFGPCLVCLMSGQLGNFFLLCLALFLVLHRSWPLVAGAVLFPFAMKPHLVAPLAVVLLLWVVDRRAWRLAGGCAGALAASCAIPLWFDPRVWEDYRRMMAVSGVLGAWVPSLSCAARFAIAPHAVWVEFVPEVCACAWALWYFLTQRDRWDWRTHGMVVLLAGALCAPYGWIYDEAILFPAVLAGVYAVQERRRSLIPIGVCAAACLAEVICGVQINTPYYLWTTPAWLGCYMYATRPATSEAG